MNKEPFKSDSSRQSLQTVDLNEDEIEEALKPLTEEQKKPIRELIYKHMANGKITITCFNPLKFASGAFAAGLMVQVLSKLWSYLPDNPEWKTLIDEHFLGIIGLASATASSLSIVVIILTKLVEEYWKNTKHAEIMEQFEINDDQLKEILSEPAFQSFAKASVWDFIKGNSWKFLFIGTGVFTGFNILKTISQILGKDYGIGAKIVGQILTPLFSTALFTGIAALPKINLLEKLPPTYPPQIFFVLLGSTIEEYIAPLASKVLGGFLGSLGDYGPLLLASMIGTMFACYVSCCYTPVNCLIRDHELDFINTQQKSMSKTEIASWVFTTPIGKLADFGKWGQDCF